MFTLESRLKQSLCTLLGVPADQQWVDLVKTINSYGFLSVRMPKNRLPNSMGKMAKLKKKISFSHSATPRGQVARSGIFLFPLPPPAPSRTVLFCFKNNLGKYQHNQATTVQKYLLTLLYVTLSLYFKGFSSTLLIQISSLVHCLNDTFRGVLSLSSTTSFNSYERNILQAICF